MDPGVLVPDIRHFKKIFVKACIDQCLLEQGLVSLGRAGGNHNPVQVLLLDHLGNGLLGICRTGKQIVGDILHVGERSCVITHFGNVHHPSDIDAAMANKYADARPFSGDLFFFRDLDMFCQSVPCPAQPGPCFCSGRTGFNDRLGNILRALKGPAHINPLPGCRYGIKRFCFAEPSLAQIDV